jgi:uncharacterized protein (DUF2062 family)
MPKHTLKRYMPSPRKLREFKALHLLGDWIYQPNLWHINRHSSSVAFFVGLFVAFIPLPGQMVIAAIMAVLVRYNLPIAVGLCWITNPVTIPPIFYLAYKVGAVLLGEPPIAVEFELSWEWAHSGLVLIWQPLLMGCLVCGLFFGSLGYAFINLLWRWQVTRRWRVRRHARRAVREKATRDVALQQEAVAQHDALDKALQENTSEPPPR